MCNHHWIISDDEHYHQVGRCTQCEGTYDFGVNPTIPLQKFIYTTEYVMNPFTQFSYTKHAMVRREHDYPKPNGSFYPFTKEK